MSENIAVIIKGKENIDLRVGERVGGLGGRVAGRCWREERGRENKNFKLLAIVQLY